MNYCIVAFAIIMIISTVQWFVDGRKNFTGPKLDLDAMQSGVVVGMAPGADGVDRSSTSQEKEVLGGGGSGTGSRDDEENGLKME
jgi:choline transport protein